MNQKQKDQDFITGDLEVHSRIKSKHKNLQEKTSSVSFLKKQRTSIQPQQNSYQEIKDLMQHYKEKYEKQAKQKIALQRKLQQYELKLNRLIQIRYNKNLFCKKCFMQEKVKQKHEILQEFYSFSSIVQNKLKKFSESSKINLSEQSILHNRDIPLIQNFAVFGIPEDIIQYHINQIDADELEGKVILSLNPYSSIEEQAAKFVFPSGMTIKKVVGDRIIQKVTEVMTKSYSKQNSFLLRFECQEQKVQNYNPNKLLQILNPSKKLFCLCVGTYDFTFLNKQDKDFATSTSSMQALPLPNSELMLENRCSISQIIQKSDIISPNKRDEIGITQRVYCIMSYFPFFSFFQDIILSFLSIIKVQRLEIYKHRIQQLKQIDSNFQISRIKQLFNEYIINFNKQVIELDQIYQLKFLNQSHTLITKESFINFNYIENWIYQIISLFNIDTFMETLTLVLLQDRVVFVCQNSHILTYTIYLFVSLLCRPFNYTFPSAYIIPNEQFLNAPFPVVYGLLKRKQWLEDNRIKQRFKNTYIYLSAAGVEIVRTQKQRNFRQSEKLRSVLTVIFRDLEKFKKINKKQLKYDKQPIQYAYHSTQAERDSCQKIIESVKKFLHDDIILIIPPKQTILEIKNSITKESIPKTKDFHTFLMDKIIQIVLQKHKNEHKLQYKNQKEPIFIQQFMQTQMINVYLSNLSNA